MRSDWHRYNLKRRVASLPPLSSEIFAEKVLSAQATTSAAAAKASFETLCEVCQKKFYSENAYQNHLGSQRHLANLKVGRKGSNKDDEVASLVSSTISLGPPISKDEDLPAAVERVDSEAKEEFEEIVDGIKNAAIEDEDPLSRRPSRPHHSSNEEENRDHPISPLPSDNATEKPASSIPGIDLTHCLFCPTTCTTVALNLIHMSLTHGTFIPEQPYLTDLEGLLTYLYTKIAENNECLYCHKLRSSKDAVQTHMRDKGHCMIGFTSEAEMLEVGQFYDFRSTYSDDEDDDEVGVKINDTEMPDADGNADEDWEDTSDIASDLSSENDDVPSIRNGNAAHLLSEHELILPSGRTAGHRSLKRYFRQHLRDTPYVAPTPRHRLLTNGHQRRSSSSADDDQDVQMTNNNNNNNNNNNDSTIATQRSRGRSGPENEIPNQALITRANGGLGMLGVSDAKKREVAAGEKRERKRAQREQRRWEWGVEKRNNLQKHYRDPLLQ